MRRDYRAGIYQIRHFDSGKVYVGSTNCFHRRWLGHRSLLGRGIHHSPHLQHAFNRNGSEAFAFEILEYVDNAEHLFGREQHWLDHTQSTDAQYGFNVLPFSAGGRLGLPHTDESRAKMSARLKGRRLTERQKAGLKEGWVGRKAAGRVMGPERYAEIAAKNTGRLRSPESRARMTEVKRRHAAALTDGERTAMSQRAAGHVCVRYVVTHPDGHEETVFGLGKWCRDHGLQQSCMWSCAEGRQRAHKGYRCRHEGDTVEEAEAAWQAYSRDKRIVGRRSAGRGGTPKWRVFPPAGDPVEVASLSAYCLNRGLTSANMYVVASGRYANHKGYGCQRIDPMAASETKA